MALIEVKVPQLSESVAEATLLQWKKKPGEAVDMDEVLVEIETDKVVLEVPAPAAGVLAQVIKNDGDSCVADEVIAKIDTEGEEAVSGAMQIRSVPPAEPAPGQTAGIPASVAALAETKSAIAMPAAAASPRGTCSRSSKAVPPRRPPPRRRPRRPRPPWLRQPRHRPGRRCLP